ILADAMGLGKTVMTIALILARQGRDTLRIKNRLPKVRWKLMDRHKDILSSSLNKNLLNEQDKLETHSKPDSISISVFIGGDRSSDPRVIAEPDMILTTYGVLTAACTNDGENSIFYRVDWYRVVLDEARTIKSSKTLGAQAAFKLSSYCRWCLTGTPLQNKLEDLYNLLCFLHVEPWCN
ncbi:DNA repair protein RAD5B-like, partial [Coffea eugenioides]|uniref:DNA repair protein RAD5B-like n=1 Tax=Coffea eugenioides TaxID=49369 RepID=UPI000F60FF9F